MLASERSPTLVLGLAMVARDLPTAGGSPMGPVMTGPAMTGQVMAIGWTSTVACKGRHISLGNLLGTAVRRPPRLSRRTQMACGGRHLGRGVG
jgi:hypothetical protein